MEYMLLLTLLILGIFITPGSAIYCFVCDVQDGERCIDGTGLKAAQECDPAYDQCAKTVSVSQILNKKTGDLEDRFKVVTRSCGKNKVLKDECWYSKANQGSTIRCFCSGEQCNSASSSSYSLLLGATALLLVALHLRLL